MNYSDYPAHLDIESTNICDLACVMCPYPIMERKKGYMDMTTLVKLIDESRGKSVTSFLHQIGEPLLHKKIIEMINYTSEAGIRTSISTNGMRLDVIEKYEAQDWIMRLCESKLNELTIALDGMTKEVYEQYRVKGNFDQVVTNLDNFLILRKQMGKGPQVIVQFIQMKENDGDVDAFKKKYVPMVEGIGEVWVKPYSRFAGYVDDHGHGGTEPLRFTCNKVKTHITIHWNGDAVICCRDFAGFTIVGNVNEQTIEEIWHGPAYQHYREQHEKKNWEGNVLCQNC